MKSWASATRRRKNPAAGPCCGSSSGRESSCPDGPGPEAVARARRRHAETMAELPAVVNRLQRGEPAIPTVYA